jgi:hypothetical protein
MTMTVEPSELESSDATSPPPFARALPVRRPASGLVVGICGIVWASIHLMSILFGLLMFLVPTGVPNPTLDAMRSNRAMMVYSFSVSGAGLILAAVLLVGSIGLIRLRPWARRTVLVWAVLHLLMSIAAMLANWFWIQPLIETIERQQNVPEQFLLVGRIIGACSAVIFGVIAPLVVIYLLNRPGMKAAYGGLREQSESTVNFPAHGH